MNVKTFLVIMVSMLMLSFLIIHEMKNMEERIREDINMNTALIKIMPRTIPAVLYNPQDNKCVLVYPDSLSYKRPKWIKE